MPGYVSKLLFPKLPPTVRQRKMQALRFVLAGAVLTAAAVAAMIWAVNEKMQH